MDAKAENRQLPRSPANFSVACRSKGQEQEGRALNLSRGGVLVATASPLPVGTLTEVTLAAPGADVIQFKGIVRHATQDVGMGIEFVEVLPDHQPRLAEYLDKLGLGPRPAGGSG